MNLIRTPNILLKTALLLVSSAFSSISFAHSAGAILGAVGNNAHATAFAAITCFDDGNGSPAGLFAEIRGGVEPEDGGLISMQLHKGRQVTSTTDTVLGDADFSEAVQLNAGPGVYNMFVNKTDEDSIQFEVTWHCMTKDQVHTGTDITIRQFQ
ncbi:hypothetical protein [Methyloprofundus sp.]|uniref:hypothetical protein n=1 Tax=Methyloprofundus sp. TaxID=2020875 RepID=UPI003D149C7B